MLQHADLFVTNGGYGSIQHGLSHGRPLVVGGEHADKAENATRVEWSGAGINLHTNRPNSDKVYDAVREIITNPRHRTRAREIQAEIQKYDPVGVVIENIEVVTRLKSKSL